MCPSDAHAETELLAVPPEEEPERPMTPEEEAAMKDSLRRDFDVDVEDEEETTDDSLPPPGPPRV
jgi:hypothetical protein